VAEEKLKAIPEYKPTREIVDAIIDLEDRLAVEQDRALCHGETQIAATFLRPGRASASSSSPAT
jgi:hypothetical protein